MITQEQVNEALNDAVANDYSFKGWSVYDIVCDMLAYWEPAENSSEDELTPLVTAWRNEHPEAIV